MNKVAQDILKKHAKSFYFAGLFLDRKTLNDAAILYAFCRQLDDAADQEEEQDKLDYLIADYKKEVPDDLINKLLNASKFNQGFINTEYLAASLLDMDWHTISSDEDLKDANQFESESMKKYGLTIHELNESEMEMWDLEVKRVSKYLRGNIIPESIYDTVIRLTDK